MLLLAGAALVSVAASALLLGDDKSQVEDSTQIFVVKRDGSGLRKLTTGPDSHSSFGWLRDGDRIAYSSPRGYTVESVDGPSRRLTTKIDRFPFWSPARDEVALFSGGKLCETGGRCMVTLQLARPDGSDSRTVMSRKRTTLFKCCPAWSPDGEKLAYSEQLVQRRVPVVDGPVDLVVVSRNGERRQIEIDGDEWDPEWSPDGRSLLFIRGQLGGLIGLWTSSPSGHRLRRVVERVLAQAPATWSPDSRTIAFTGALTRTGGTHVYLVSAKGDSPPRVLVKDTTEFAPSWSPDGSLVAFADFEGHIRVVRPDGSGDREVTRLSNATIYDLAWSPNGRWIAFAAAKRPPDT